MPLCPAGWYGVALSREVSGKRPLPLTYLGRKFVAFRDASGAPRVLDAFCPHMGANLGEGGAVRGGELVCPFHGWRFDGEGRCTGAPYARKLPLASVPCHTVREANGIVFLWHHPRGAPPAYEIPSLPENDRARWTGFSELRLRLRTHVQEIRENFCDESHFAFIHDQGGPAELRFEADGPRAEVTTKVVYRVPVLGRVLTFDSRGSMYGPGFMIVRTTGMVDSAALALSTPIDEEESELRLLFTAKKPRWAPPLGLLFRRNIHARARRDLLREGRIWEHKRWLPRPLIQAHEPTTPIFRKWYQQFYEA